MITLFEDFNSENYIASEEDFNFIEPGDTLIAKCDIYFSKPHYMVPKKLAYGGEKLFAKKGSKKKVLKSKYGGIKLNGFNVELSNNTLNKFFTIKNKDKIETLKNIKKFNI